MAEAAATSYDEVPYGSNVFYYTHPDRLAAVAALLGLRAPPVDRCRVLELGCGTGANLLPMAQDLPGSHFVGIDLSPRQIAMGQEAVDALRLSNLDLRAMSIMAVDEGFGTFDYVICHGVYSWVPAEVQDKILAICAANLATNGVAYVSYNTYPGWHVRGMIREMMGFHVRRFSEPHVRVQQARALMDFLMRAVGDTAGPYRESLAREAELLAESSDTYLYHEHLEEVNYPVYFYQFAQRAAARGLQYLAEARPSLLAANLPADVIDSLEAMSSDLIEGEQYLDFVRNRTFRRTLLCHDRVRLQRPPSPAALAGLQLTGVVKPQLARPDLRSDSAEEFVAPEGTRLTTNNPLFKCALTILAEYWPRAVPFAELWAQVCGRLGPAAMGDAAQAERGRESLADALLQCYLSNLVEIHAHAPRLVVDLSERPVASPLARLQASGDAVTNLRHRTVELNEIDRAVLPLLDGSRDRAALLDGLADLVARDVLVIQRNGGPLREARQVRAVLAEALEPSLHRLAGSALLIG
jgi:methyltransferase-like protein/SAM-dependent methyltransferase